MMLVGSYNSLVLDRKPKGSEDLVLRGYSDRAHEITPPEHGQKVPGIISAIGAGAWSPMTRSGKDLGLVVDVFFSPMSLSQAFKKNATFTFNAAKTATENLKGWFGFDGFKGLDPKLPYEEALYSALSDGTYTGGWVVPPESVLNQVGGWQNNLGSIVASKQYAGSFPEYNLASRIFDRHWSCSSKDGGIASVYLPDGSSEPDRPDGERNLCMPVRFEIR